MPGYCIEPLCLCVKGALCGEVQGAFLMSPSDREKALALAHMLLELLGQEPGEDGSGPVERPGTSSTHHRRPRCLGGTDDPKNLARVDRKLHAAYHQLFGPGEPRVIGSLLNNQWLDPDVTCLMIDTRDRYWLRDAVRALNTLAGPQRRVYCGRNISRKSRIRTRTKDKKS